MLLAIQSAMIKSPVSKISSGWLSTGSASTVYGWVDAADVQPIKPAITKGCKVRVAKGAKTYNGGTLAAFVYNTVYNVMQIDSDRVVIGLGGVVTAAVNIKDLTLA